MYITRPSLKIGRYKMIKHKLDKGNDVNPKRYTQMHLNVLLWVVSRMLLVLLVGCKIELFVEKQFKKTIRSHNFLYFVFLTQRVSLYWLLVMRDREGVPVCSQKKGNCCGRQYTGFYTKYKKIITFAKKVMWFKWKFQELLMISQETPDCILEIFWGTLGL